MDLSSGEARFQLWSWRLFIVLARISNDPLDVEQATDPTVVAARRMVEPPVGPRSNAVGSGHCRASLIARRRVAQPGVPAILDPRSPKLFALGHPGVRFRYRGWNSLRTRGLEDCPGSTHYMRSYVIEDRNLPAAPRPRSPYPSSPGQSLWSSCCVLEINRLLEVRSELAWQSTLKHR